MLPAEMAAAKKPARETMEEMEANRALDQWAPASRAKIHTVMGATRPQAA